MDWKIEPGVEVFVLILGIGPLDPFGPPVFNVTQYVRGDPGITITRGRSTEFDSFQSGTCTFELDNTDRRFDPLNMTSPFMDILMPSRWVLVAATYQGAGTNLFIGYIDGWPQSQDSSGDSRPTVQIVAHDLMALMSRTRVSQVAFTLDVSSLDMNDLSGNLPQQYTGERVEALLGLAGFGVSTLIDADRGKTIMPASDGTSDILTQIRDAEFAEAGFFYVNRLNGTLTFLDRHARFEDPRLATLQATFTDHEYSDISIDNDLVRTWNDARFSQPGGQPQIARDEVCIQDHGLLTFPESGGSEDIQVISDGEALGRAQFWVQRYSGMEPRPSPIVIKPRRNVSSLFRRCIDRELMDRIQIIRTPQGIGDPITFTGHVQSITHQITNDDWTTTLAIAPFDIQDDEGFLILDDATHGTLASGNALAY